jgi:hypothetical protein
MIRMAMLVSNNNNDSNSSNNDSNSSNNDNNNNNNKYGEKCYGNALLQLISVCHALLRSIMFYYVWFY